MITQRFGATLLIFVVLLAPSIALARPSIATTRAPLAWTIEAVDTEGEVGQGSSLALDTDGNPHISYYDQSNSTLKYARRVDGTWNIEVVDSGTGEDSALALDAGGFPHVCYVADESLRYAYKDASGWHRETISVASRSSFPHVNLVLDTDSNPHISYG